jgi:hypothetical protein
MLIFCLNNDIIGCNLYFVLGLMTDTFGDYFYIMRYYIYSYV